MYIKYKIGNTVYKKQIGGSNNDIELTEIGNKYIDSPSIITLDERKIVTVIGDIHGDISVFYKALLMTGLFENCRYHEQGNKEFENNIHKCQRKNEIDTYMVNALKWKDCVENNIVIFDGDLFDAKREYNNEPNFTGVCCNEKTQISILNTIYKLKEDANNNQGNDMIWVLGNHDMFNLIEKEGKSNFYVPNKLFAMRKQWVEKYKEIKPVACVLLKSEVFEKPTKYIYICHGGICQEWINELLNNYSHVAPNIILKPEFVTILTNTVYDLYIKKENRIDKIRGDPRIDNQFDDILSNIYENVTRNILPTWCRPIDPAKEEISIPPPEIEGEYVSQIVAHTVVSNNHKKYCICMDKHTNDNEYNKWTDFRDGICRTDFGMGRSIRKHVTSISKKIGFIQIKKENQSIQKKYIEENILEDYNYDFTKDDFMKKY